MSLQPATMVVNGNAVGGLMPDTSSALGYKETIGQVCVNPNGYSIGQFFVGATDGYLYRVTSNISTGDTITVGTNCVQTSVADVLTTINASLTELESKQVKVKATTRTFNNAGESVIFFDGVAQTTSDIRVIGAYREDSNGYMLIPFVSKSTQDNKAYWYIKVVNSKFAPVSGTLTVAVIYVDV